MSSVDEPLRQDEAVLQLAATLLPGGAGFPPAAATGMGPVLCGRLRASDPAGPATLLAALTVPPPADGPAWVREAARLEAVEPALFGELRRQAYIAYYEQPEVIAAIRALGHPYNDAPLPDGYPVAAFDPAVDAPRHARGRWVDTEAVRPVAVGELDLESLR